MRPLIILADGTKASILPVNKRPRLGVRSSQATDMAVEARRPARYPDADGHAELSHPASLDPGGTALSFAAALFVIGFLGFAFYPRSDFMHIDLGPKREWGERFAPRPAFARETPPARERLVESRTIKGGGVAGVASVRAAGVEVAQEVLAGTQDALPLVPYLDSLRWVLGRR